MRTNSTSFLLPIHSYVHLLCSYVATPMRYKRKPIFDVLLKYTFLLNYRLVMVFRLLIICVVLHRLEESCSLTNECFLRRCTLFFYEMNFYPKLNITCVCLCGSGQQSHRRCSWHIFTFALTFFQACTSFKLEASVPVLSFSSLTVYTGWSS